MEMKHTRIELMIGGKWTSASTTQSWVINCQFETISDTKMETKIMEKSKKNNTGHLT